VDMPDRWKRKRVLHINMLQKWHKPTVTATSYMADKVPSDREETEVLPYAHRDAVQKELQEMLDCGIIECSRSE